LFVYNQQHRIWPDLNNTPPVDEAAVAVPTEIDFAMTLCYEYRPTVADHFVLGVEFPARLLFGLDGSFRGCSPGLLTPLLRKLRMGAKTGTIVLDILLALGIAEQWWLIGWRIDSLNKANRSAWLWIVPVVVISLAGCLMVPAGLGVTDWPDFMAALASGVAFLVWVFLLVVTIVIGIKAVLLRRTNAQAA